MVITLPSCVVEDGLPDFLGALWQPVDGDRLDFDFSRVVFYIPAAITMLIARIDHARRSGVTGAFIGLHECKSFRYLQRIDFFDQLGIALPEDFERHDTGTAFVPLREVVPSPVSIRDDPLATDLARCVADAAEGDVFQLSQYSLGEIIANLKQHACQRGFVCAQYMKQSDLVRIGIADSGIGIREGFRQNSAPKYQAEMNDAQVLELAMSLFGSSKAHLTTPYGESPNRGVGLTITRFMVAESYGHFFLASGTSWWFRNGLGTPKDGVFANGASIQGTVLSLGYQRDQVTNYPELRQQAWAGLGLTSDPRTRSLFS